jgi:hypothetical protein
VWFPVQTTRELAIATRRSIRAWLVDGLRPESTRNLCFVFSVKLWRTPCGTLEKATEIEFIVESDLVSDLFAYYRTASAFLHVHRPRIDASRPERNGGEKTRHRLSPNQNSDGGGVAHPNSFRDARVHKSPDRHGSDRILGFTVFGVEAGEIMASVQIAMLAGLPYTALRDAVLTHPTLLEGLIPLFSSVPPISKSFESHA